jgi:hypothetical protein
MAGRRLSLGLIVKLPMYNVLLAINEACAIQLFIWYLAETMTDVPVGSSRTLPRGHQVCWTELANEG